MTLIEPGSRAPAFTLLDQHGHKHRLSEHKGSPVVLFFYPKDDTTGCTKEACGFRDLSAEFERAGIIVFGISPQGVDSKAKFAAKHRLNFPILADEGSKVCEKYGVWQEKSMYGRNYMGVVRTTYLIRPSGAVEKRWDKVRVSGHADKVYEAACALECVQC
jgi:peroxiredoxin Q/BCP